MPLKEWHDAVTEKPEVDESAHNESNKTTRSQKNLEVN